jgi:hypothetical protein
LALLPALIMYGLPAEDYRGRYNRGDKSVTYGYIIRQGSGLFTIHTARTTYQCVRDPGILLRLYYGPRIVNQDMRCLIKRRDRRFSGCGLSGKIGIAGAGHD